MSYTSRDPRPLGKDYYSAPLISARDVPPPPTLTSLTAFRHRMARGMFAGEPRVFDAIYMETISRVLDKGVTEQEKGLAKVFVKSIQVEATQLRGDQRRLNIEETHNTTEQALDIEFPLFIGPSIEWYSHPVTGTPGGNLGGRRIRIDLDELNYVEDGEPHKGVGVEQKGGWLTRDYLRTGRLASIIGPPMYSRTDLLNLPYTRHLFPGEGMKIDADGLHETIDRRDQGQKATFNLNFLFEHVSRRWDIGGATRILYPTRGYNIQDSNGSGSAVEDVTTENQREMEPISILGDLATMLFLPLNKFILFKIGLSGVSVWGLITGILPSFGFVGIGGLTAKVAAFFGAIKAGVLGVLLTPVFLAFGKLIAIAKAVFAVIMKVVVIVNSIEILSSPFSAWLKNKLRDTDRENYWSAGSKLPTRLRNRNMLWNGDTYRVKMSNQFVNLHKTEQGNVVEQRKTQFVTLPINKLYDNLDDAITDLGVNRVHIRHIDYERFADSDYMQEQDDHLKEIANEF